MYSGTDSYKSKILQYVMKVDEIHNERFSLSMCGSYTGVLHFWNNKMLSQMEQRIQTLKTNSKRKVQHGRFINGATSEIDLRCGIHLWIYRIITPPSRKWDLYFIIHHTAIGSLQVGTAGMKIKIMLSQIRMKWFFF